MEKTRKLNNLPPEQKQITEREYREYQNALKNVKKVVAAATQDGTTQAQVSSTTTTVLPELALLASKFASPPISMSSVTSGGFGSLSICTCDLSSSPQVLRTFVDRFPKRVGGSCCLFSSRSWWIHPEIHFRLLVSLVLRRRFCRRFGRERSYRFRHDVRDLCWRYSFE